MEMLDFFGLELGLDFFQGFAFAQLDGIHVFWRQLAIAHCNLLGS